MSSIACVDAVCFRLGLTSHDFSAGTRTLFGGGAYHGVIILQENFRKRSKLGMYM
jgi:hypothetical protein